MVRSMAKEELMRHGCLWAGNVQEAFETYESVIISAGSRQVYYRADREIMEFLLEITVTGWLFSTFYFAHKKAIIWGNYNMEFPVFCENRETLACYTGLAKECGLECHE